MTYLNITTGAYPLSATDVRAAHPNTSFPSDVAGFEACLSGLGYAVVQPITQPEIDHTKNLTEGKPAKIGTNYKQTWVVADATAAEITERTNAQAASVRQERNRRLAACDWTQVADAPEQTRSAWVQYRQDLRSLPQQSGFPWEITWPSQPA